jgi:hypothetical protein
MNLMSTKIENLEEGQRLLNGYSWHQVISAVSVDHR